MTHSYRYTLGSRTFGFRDLAELMAKATPQRSGDRLAGVIALSAEERAEVLKLHDLLRRCLSYDPAKRLTAATALQHAFFKKQPGSDKKARRK